MREKEKLHLFWKKNIDIPLYRTIAERDFLKVKRFGLDPSKNPYAKMEAKLEKLFSLVSHLEEKGFVMKFLIGKRESLGSYYANMARYELGKKMIDFTPIKGHFRYYKSLRGGAMISCVRRLTDRLLENREVLSNVQFDLVRELNEFAVKSACEMKLIRIRGSLSSLSCAKFHLTGTTKGKVRRVHSVKYLPSPFGDFDNFVKVVQRKGLRKYSFRLRNKKYYLRATKAIPVKEITFI